MSASNPTVKRTPKSTYSDLPIQLAERVVSEIEFVDEIFNYSRSDVLLRILNQLIQYKEGCLFLQEERYSFNEILKRGAIEFSFLENQLLDTIMVGLNSMHFLSGKIIIEKNVKFEVYIQGNTIKLENHQGFFAILTDGRRKIKAKIESISVEDNIDGGITILVDCLNPYSSTGINNTIQLMIASTEKAKNNTSVKTQELKNRSMREFRESYGRLDALKSNPRSSSSWLDRVREFKLWMAGKIHSCLKQK